MADKNIGKRKYCEMSSKAESQTKYFQNHPNSSKVENISITSLMMKPHIKHAKELHLAFDSCFRLVNEFPSFLKDFTDCLTFDMLNFEKLNELDKTIPNEVSDDLERCDWNLKCFESPINFTGDIL